MNGRTRRGRGAREGATGKQQLADAGVEMAVAGASLRTSEPTLALRAATLGAVLRDVQTPLAALELNLALLADDLESATGDALVSLRDARSAARRIRQYVDHFIESEIFGAAAMRRRRRRVDVGAVLQRLMEEYREHALEQAISLELELPAEPVICARGDEVLLERVFQNALEAVLCMPSNGGCVRIEARASSVVEIVFSRATSATRQPDWRQSVFAVLSRHDFGRALQVHGGSASLECDERWAARLHIRLPTASL